MSHTQIFSGLIISLAMVVSLQAAQDPTPATPLNEEAATAPVAPGPAVPAQSGDTQSVPPPTASTSATAQPTATSDAFSPKVVEAIGTPSESKGLVVFFRPSKFVGAAVGFIVREDKAELGKLRSGNYFTVDVEPGKHTYVVHSEAKDTTTLEIEAGETYFLSGSISMGFLAGRPHLTPSNAAAFEEALPKLKRSTPLK